VGRGEAWIPLNGGIWVEAYHDPGFSTNILSVGLLGRQFIISFTRSIKDYNGCFIIMPKTNQIIWDTPIKEGLYRIQLSSSTQVAMSTSRNSTAADEALHWHSVVGHPSAVRYQTLSRMLQSVPQFDINVLKQLECVPCITAKARRASVLPARVQVSQPLELVHLDISGPVKSSLAGNIFALSILDSKTSKSEVVLRKSKADLFEEFVDYKTKSEAEQFLRGLKLRNVRLGGAGENTSTAIQSFCRQHGIRLQYSPPYASESNGGAERLVQEH